MDKEKLKEQTEKMIDEKTENIEEKIRKTADSLFYLTNKAKKKYEKTDNKTKVVASLIASAAMIAGAIGLMKIIQKKKKDKDD